jgi:hypothetical protein
MGLNKRYIFVAALLILIVFIVSIFLYPEWWGNWYLLALAVIIGVVGFIANFRQAFEKKKEDAGNNSVFTVEREKGKRPGTIKTGKLSSGKDILVSVDGDVTKIAAQINLPNINISSSPFHGSGSAPPPPSLMIGREDDLIALKERLNVTSHKPLSIQVLTAIKGWPGVGKTTIASALAYDSEILSQFPDGVLWASLGQDPNILSEMANWGRSLGTDEILKAKSIEDAQSLLARLLQDKHMLLIIDDVWKVEDAVPFKVGGVGCATLITTRLEVVASALAPVAENIYRLQVLEDEDALDLVKELAPSVLKQHPDECLVLVRELEGLPLALQVAGRMLNTEANYGFSVIELIDDLRDGAKLLEASAPADRADLVNETTPTIAALLQKSLDRLDDTTRDCYAYLGVFAPKPATFDLEAMKFVWQVEDPKPIVKTLVDRGLLEYVKELNRYQMHALLVMLAKTMLIED